MVIYPVSIFSYAEKKFKKKTKIAALTYEMFKIFFAFTYNSKSLADTYYISKQNAFISRADEARKQKCIN